jgi:hypothetical protein
MGRYKSMIESVRSILSRLDCRDCRLRSGSFPVWDISCPGLVATSERRSSVHSAKVALLELLRDSLQPAFIFHQDSPIVEGVTASWLPTPDGGWRVPRDLSFHDSETAYWLFTLGNWSAIARKRHSEIGWPDPFQTDASDLLIALRTSGVALLIASFPDDTAWVVAWAGGECV